LELADVVDLEWLLANPDGIGDDVVRAALPAATAAAARGGDPADARARLDRDPRLRRELCAAVLAAARVPGADLPGRAIARALGWAGVLLAAAGLLLGGSTAFGVLAYDGHTPVNVLHFVLVFVALQIVLLVLMVWFVLRARGGGGPALPHRLAASLVERLLGARGRAAADALRHVSSRHALYADVERWTLFALVQRFGVAFNVAALAVLLLLVTGTDLTFSWSTTLSVDGRTAHAVVRAIALPWAWWPEAVPSLATVEASQWVRMPGGFVRPTTPEATLQHAATWWRFLAAGLVTYGLLPRTLALLLGTWRARRAVHAAGLDHAGFHALYERLLPRTAAFAGPDPASVRGAAPAAGTGPATPHAPRQPGARAVLLCWGSAARAAEPLRTALAARSGLAIDAPLAVGGAVLADDERALQQLAARPPQRALVVFAPGQQPTADTLAFLRGVRARLGAGKPIVAVLGGAGSDGALRDAEPDEHTIWKRSLGTLGDAHLWLEGLEGAR
jgi:hypothetical protein